MYRRHRRPRLTAAAAKHQQQLQLHHHQQFDSITSSSASTTNNRQERLMLVSVDSGGVGNGRHRTSASSVTQFCCSSTTAASLQQQQVLLNRISVHTFIFIGKFVYYLHIELQLLKMIAFKNIITYNKFSCGTSYMKCVVNIFKAQCHYSYYSYIVSSLTCMYVVVTFTLNVTFK